MKYVLLSLQFFLLSAVLLGFSDAGVARPCLPDCDTWDKSCVRCPKSSGRKCIKPTNYRSVCKNGWDETICNCAQAPSASDNNGAAESSAAVAQAVQQCQSHLAEAQNDCDQDRDTGIQGAQTTLSNFAVQMGSQMGIQAACSGIGKALAGANGAVAAFSQLCTTSKNKCSTSCNNAKTAVASTGTEAIYQTQVEDSIRQCRALDAKIQQASQAIGNMVGTMQGAQACANQTNTDLFDFCKSNPSAIGCENAVTDCSNPTVAASNPICICKANPSAATCTGASLKADGGFGEGDYNSASLGAGGASGSSGSLESSGFLGDASWGGDPNAKADPSRAEDVGGSKGGRPLDEGSGGKSAGGGSGGGGGANSAAGVAVNSGFRGGGGGWSSGGGGGSWVGAGTAAPAGAPAGNINPDLRQFLPGGKFDPKTRGLAGISGPDGITGPHTDIWKKIQNRYQVKQPTLMP